MAKKNTVYLTQDGLDSLKKELDDLINVRRPENIQAIKKQEVWETYLKMQNMMLLEMNKQK